MQYEVIEAYKARIARLNATATRTTPTYTDNPSSGITYSDGRMTAKAAAMDYEKELATMQMERAATVEELWAVVVKLGIPINQKEVIRLRDLNGMDWGDIARDMDLTERWCQDLQTKAYKNIVSTSVEQRKVSVDSSLSSPV
jgi:predicted DNA-binding protein (UPF0251 family)